MTKILFQKQFLLLLGIVIATVGIRFFEAVFRLQAKLNLAHNVKVIIIFVEEENVEVEIAILIPKINLDNICSTNGILQSYYDVFRQTTRVTIVPLP